MGSVERATRLLDGCSLHPVSDASDPLPIPDKPVVRVTPTPSKATVRISLIPKSLKSHHPSAAEKCRAEGQCRMCERLARVRPLTQHHVVPLEWWRTIGASQKHVRNANANVVPLCRPCHDDVESRDHSVRMPARSMLRHRFSQQEIAFVIACTGGLAWLERHYPVTWYVDTRDRDQG